MRILITAGGTSEKIDAVRAITNGGTGQLGAIIADRLALAADVNQIVYVCSAGAIRPETTKANVLIADDTQTLDRTVSELCKEGDIDAVVHSMAVSDYRVKTVTTAEALAAQIIAALGANAFEPAMPEQADLGEQAHEKTRHDRSVPKQDAQKPARMAAGTHETCDSGQSSPKQDAPQPARMAAGAHEACDSGQSSPKQDTAELARMIAETPALLNDGKISSNLDNPLLILERTPKIISMFRALLPKACLIGFKLLTDVSETTLIDTAYGLLRKNDCDYVLANDLAHIRAGSHIGHLVDRQKSYQTHHGKDAIAAAIAEKILGSRQKGIEG